MQNGNDSTPGGSLLDRIADDLGVTLDALLTRVNDAMAAAGAQTVSRTTFWRWRTMDRLPDIEQALVLQQTFGIPVHTWARQTQSQEVA